MTVPEFEGRTNGCSRVGDLRPWWKPSALRGLAAYASPVAGKTSTVAATGSAPSATPAAVPSAGSLLGLLASAPTIKTWSGVGAFAVWFDEHGQPLELVDPAPVMARSPGGPRDPGRRPVPARYPDLVAFAGALLEWTRRDIEWRKHRRVHGSASVCPRHGETRGGLCRQCARARR